MAAPNNSLTQAADVLDAVYSLKLKTDGRIKDFVLENFEKFITEKQEDFIGPQGIPGIQGPRGFDGPQGLVGLGILKVDSRLVDKVSHLIVTRSDGKEFDLGEYQGPQGERGPRGPQGFDGLNGLPGRDGVDGLQGPEGPIGKTGKASQIHYIKVERDIANDIANLIIKYDSGEFPIEKNLGNIIGPRGARGQRGEPGITGPQGLAGPKGEKGDRGLIGMPGPMGPQGIRGETGTSMVFRGEWAKNERYNKGDLVSYYGALYYAKEKPTGAPGIDKAWVLMIQSLPGRAAGGNIPARVTTSLIEWQASTTYVEGDMVYLDNKLYRAEFDHVSGPVFATDFRTNNLWSSLSGVDITYPLQNGATNVNLPVFTYLPSQFRYLFVDVVTKRRSSTVAASYYSLQLLFTWDGTAWIKSESSKTYFGNTSPADNITFTTTTRAGDNALLVGVTTPLMGGVYDATFSEIAIIMRNII
jgi:Collagen triple helix repeat (20 copies)